MYVYIYVHAYNIHNIDNIIYVYLYTIYKVIFTVSILIS